MKVVIYLVGLFWIGFAGAQSRALTKPFKYLRPTETTDFSMDPRKSPYVWRVYIDRKDVNVFADQELKNKSSVYPKFMDEFIVAGETNDALLLFLDEDIDSIRFSKNAQKIGWVKKENLILWDRFLWGSDLAKQIVLATWEDISNSESTIEPSQFLEIPTGNFNYLIFNIVKFDVSKQNVLLSLRTFNPANPELFCWVDRSSIKLLDERSGYIPNRRLTGGNPRTRPSIYVNSTAANISDPSNTAFQASEIKAEQAFLPASIKSGNLLKVTWSSNNIWQEGFMNTSITHNNEKTFVSAALLNRQEFSILKRSIEILSNSTTVQELVERWKGLLSSNSIQFYEGLGQLQLLEELTGVRFKIEVASNGSIIEDLLFMRTEEFNAYKYELEQCAMKLMLIENEMVAPYNFAPFNYPHYWLPLDILPVDILTRQYNSFSDTFEETVEELWDYSKTPVSYGSFDLFYIENSHNYGSNFQLKDQVIRTFYRSAARIRPNDSDRSGFVFFSNVQKPFTGVGGEFVENVAGMMREGVVSKPNQYNDKKLLRSKLYAKNIKSVEILRIHFFVGDKFYEEAINANRWLLKEFVCELHEEFNVYSTEVILYSITLREDAQEVLTKINPKVPEGISYRISTINL